MKIWFIAVAEAKVREIKQQELEARRGLEQLTSGSQLKQTTEPAVVDVYQHTRYETSGKGGIVLGIIDLNNFQTSLESLLSRPMTRRAKG